MAVLNLNKIAVAITKKEGLKKQISIAQIKEILRTIFKGYSLETIIKIYSKYNKRVK